MSNGGIFCMQNKTKNILGLNLTTVDISLTIMMVPEN